MTDRCPACKQPIKQPMPPQRICARCLRPIERHHKYQFVTTEHGYTALAHRHCDDPFCYSKPVREAPRP